MFFNMGKLGIWALTCLCVAANICPAAAQDASMANTLKLLLINPDSPEWGKRGFLQSPFNVAAQKLPANFKGHSVTQVRVALGFGNKPEKGKFETTEQYQARLRGSASRTLFGKVQMSSPLAFAAAPASVDYNADTQKMAVKFDFLEDEDSLSIPTEKGAYSSRNYTATNGFGAQVEVAESDEILFGLAVTNWKNFDFAPIPKKEDEYNDRFRLTFDLTVPLKTAPKVENTIRALFVGYIAPPETAMVLEDHHKATFTEPRETATWHYDVCFRLKYALLFDAETGEVYAKLNPAKPDAPPAAAPADEKAP